MFDRGSSSSVARPDWRFLRRAGPGDCPEASLRVGPELWCPIGAEGSAPRLFWRFLNFFHCILVKRSPLAGPLYLGLGGGNFGGNLSWDPSDSLRGSGSSVSSGNLDAASGEG